MRNQAEQVPASEAARINGENLLADPSRLLVAPSLKMAGGCGYCL